MEHPLSFVPAPRMIRYPQVREFLALRILCARCCQAESMNGVIIEFSVCGTLSGNDHVTRTMETFRPDISYRGAILNGFARGHANRNISNKPGTSL